MKKILSGLLALVMLFGVIAPVGAVYAQDNQDKTDIEVQEALLEEELKFYFEEVGYLNEENEYIVTNPELLEKRIENGDEVAKDLYELNLAYTSDYGDEYQTYGQIDYGYCILRDYFGVYADLISGKLIDSFVGYVQGKAWSAAAKLLIKATGAVASKANIVIMAGQIAVAAYNCRGELAK